MLNEGVGMNDLTTSYFSIEKADRQADGTLMVYGKATDDSVDIDQQICDAAWLDRAMPAWFKSGGNIREQHSSIAAGVAKEYEAKADGHYIMAHVVDPVSVKKVDAGVLRGFSIGIKSPRVVRDQKAANGRIIDGQIVEVSLVDRPANPNCQLVLAKSVDGESSLVQVEELTEEIVKHPGHDQSSHGRGSGGAGGAGGAAGAAEGADSELSSKQKATIEGHEADARGLSDNVTDLARQDSAVRPAAQNMREAARHLNEATGAKTTDEAVSSIKKAKNAVDRAVTNLEDQNYNEEASDAFSFSKRLNTSASAIARGVGKSVEADDEIVKHPGHDQSSHGRGSGGSAGGAGGAGEAEGESGPKTPKKVVNAAITAAEDRIDSAYKDMVVSAGARPTSNPRVMDAAQMREDALNRTTDARNQIARGNERGAAASLRSAARALDGESKFGPAKQGLKDLADQVEKGFRKAPTKATDADLRKALQSVLQLISVNKSEDASMIDTTVELPVGAVGDLLKFDKAQYEAAREALANLISIEAGEMKEGHNELQSIAHLLEAVAHLHAWYEGEEAEGEVVEEETIIERAADPGEDGKMCADCNKSYKMCKCEGGFKAAKEEEADTEKGAEPNPVPSQETYATLAGTVIVPPTETPKSAEAEEPVAEEAAAVEAVEEELPAAEETTEDSEAKTEVNAADVEAIVEQVVKSATESLRAEIATLVAAKEAALEKSVSLESELAIAKSLAVAGGPKRTAPALNSKSNDMLTKAAIYKAKANATTDPVLLKGYKQLAEEYFAKAAETN